MKNITQKIFFLTIISLFIIPQVTFAAWWNPFTWKIFSEVSETKIEKTIATPSILQGASSQTAQTIPPFAFETITVNDGLGLNCKVTQLSSPSARNVVIITHGWNDDAKGWVNDMALSIAKSIILHYPNTTSDWKVCTYNWSKAADVPTLSFANAQAGSVETAPMLAFGRAGLDGTALGKTLGNNLASIHFIGHSAGANVIQNAAVQVRINSPRTSIHLTFLDAFYPAEELKRNPFGNGLTYGSDWLHNSSTWFAEQYVDTRGDNASFNASLLKLLKNTNHVLPYAYNFDITKLDPNQSQSFFELTPNYAKRVHRWPYEWYQKSIDASNNSQITNAYKYGFQLSLESGVSSLPTKYELDGDCQLASDASTCSLVTISPKETETKPSNLSGQISNAIPNNKVTTNPVNSPQQPSPATTQRGTINLHYKTGCDKNSGSPAPFVALDWSVSYENMTSQTIYRNNEVILNVPPAVGPSYFDGTVKAGKTYSYVIKTEYNDRYSSSAEANVTVPIDVCGPINFPIATNPGDIAKRLNKSGHNVTTSEIEELAAFVFLELTKKSIEVTGLQKFEWYIDSGLPSGLCPPGGISCAKSELPVPYLSFETGYAVFSTVMHEVGHLYHFALMEKSASRSDVGGADALAEGLAALFQRASVKLLQEQFKEPTYYALNDTTCNKEVIEALKFHFQKSGNIHLRGLWDQGQEGGESHLRGILWMWSIVLTDPDNPVYSILNAESPDYLTASQSIELYRYIIKMSMSKLENTRNAINENLYAKIQKIVNLRLLSPAGPEICGDSGFLSP